MTDPHAADTPASDSSAARILLVDDDRTLSAAIRFNLEEAGYAVFTAHDPQSALLLAAQTAPIDLVVTDLTLPDMSGADLVRELRVGVRDVPAIIISGLPATHARSQFTMPTNSVFLEKSTAPRMLLPTIRTLLSPPIRPHLATESESAAELRPLA